MSKEPIPKRLRKTMRQCIGMAYEHELGQALAELEESFRAWRAGDIDAFTLNERVRAYHRGPSREIWNRYQADPDLVLCDAIARGVMAEADLREELLVVLGERIAMVRKWHAQGTEEEGDE